MPEIRISYLITLLVGLVLIVSGCSGAPPPGAAAPSRPIRPLPANCTLSSADPARAVVAVAQVQPGETVCLSGDRLTDAELTVTTSGTPTQPITIVADGATVHSITVTADYVIVEGFSVFNGDGLTLRGRGLVARDNTVYNAVKDGIVCDGCIDTVIESNVVQRADGTGIYLQGERITMRDNTVSESVALTQSDADGVRFFGSGHRLTGNTIKDIKQTGYGHSLQDAPHTDCFQTYNTAHDPPTYDVVIADNVCTNVDVQCLIATANEDGAQSGPPGRTAITFEHNTCQVNGAQAVLLERFPRVLVRDNNFSGSGSRAVQLSRGSTDCAVIGNSVAGPMRPYEIDQQSQPGFQDGANVTR